jgi:hypothetical protein
MQASAVSSSRAVSLGVGIEVGAHAIDALISLESSQQSSRAVDASSTPQLTPDCFNIGNNHSPFGFSTGRSVDSGLDTLVIQTKDEKALHSQLTAQNPLRIKIDKTLADNEQILPYVSDGEFFYPVGFSEKRAEQTEILIQNLPEIETQSDNSDQASPQGKGLGKAFKVFFQKVVYDKLRLDYPESTCLSMAEFDNQGEFKHATEITEDNSHLIENANRIVLLVHGIAGEAQSMLPSVTQIDASAEQPDAPLKDAYDLVLMFDYESLNTPVQETAEILKTKLEACGLGAGHSKHLDIIAIDLGGIITRWMIEQCQCDNKHISQVVLLGVPNQGSALATLQQKGHDLMKNWAYGSLSIILNNLTSIPIGGHVVGALVKLLEAADNTLEQLHPESEVIQTLAKTQQLNTQYISITGSTAELMIDMGNKDQSQWSKMFSFVMQRSKLAAFDFLTEKLFKHPNDFAFGEQSMTAFPAAITDQVLYSKVNCDHFSYCKDINTVTQIKQALVS